MIVSEQVYCTDDVADWVMVGVQKKHTGYRVCFSCVKLYGWNRLNYLFFLRFTVIS